MESKEVRGLMEAYSSVYEQSMLNTVVDTATSVVKPQVQKQANKKFGPFGGMVAGREVDKIGSQVKSGDYGGALNRAVQGAGRLFNSVDMFDIVKGHLLDEGYADTEQAALAIMANMSEKWKQSIVEDVYKGPPKTEKPRMETPYKQKPYEKNPRMSPPEFSSDTSDPTILYRRGYYPDGSRAPKPQPRGREFTSPPS